MALREVGNWIDKLITGKPNERHNYIRWLGKEFQDLEKHLADRDKSIAALENIVQALAQKAGVSASDIKLPSDPAEIRRILR